MMRMTLRIASILKWFEHNAWLKAALWFGLLTAVAFWPLPLQLEQQFVGDYQGDFWKHAWGHWWVAQSLQAGVLPVFCQLINAPAGGYLFVADPLNALIDGVFMPLLGMARAYNLLVLISIWSGCLAAWALCCHFTKNSAASLVGGTVYGLSAYVLVYPVSSGVTETLNTALIPLFVLFLHRLTEKGQFRDWLAASVCFALTTFSCWYYGEFMVVYTALLLVGIFSKAALAVWEAPEPFCWSSGRVWTKLGLSLQRSLAAGWKSCRRPLGQAGAAVLLGGILVAPYALMFKLVVSDPANIVMPDRAPKRSLLRFKDYLGSDSPWSKSQRGIQGFHNYTNVAGFFLPGKGNATVTVTIDRLVRVHYLGWTALGLAFWALRRRQRSKFSDSCQSSRMQLGYWLVALGFFLMLSLGPRVTWSDFSPQGFINLPYLAMFIFFPMFSQLAIPFRFLILALLSLGVLASAALVQLLKKESSFWSWFAGAFVSSAVLAEVLLVSPLPWPLPLSPVQVPACYQIMALEPGDFAIIDYPFERPNTQLIPGEYFYYQTVHGRPIPYRTSGVLSTEVARSVFMEEVLMAQNGVPASTQSLDRLTVGARSLRAMGFKYFILHENLLPGFACQDIVQRLTPLLGTPWRFGDGTIIFNLDVVN